MKEKFITKKFLEICCLSGRDRVRMGVKQQYYNKVNKKKRKKMKTFFKLNKRFPFLIYVIIESHILLT